MSFIQNIKNVELSACDRADSFLQSALWGTFKSRFGWTSRSFLIDWTGGNEGPLLVLSRRLAPGLSMAYVPWGPELPGGFPVGDEERTSALAELARGLRQFLSGNTAFIRFDPPWYTEESSGLMPPRLGPPFKRASADIQPPDTVLIDILPSPQEILASMKPKWRYNIGLAEKRGVTVSSPGPEGIEVFYKLLAETAARDGIAIHQLEYYRTLFELCRTKGASADVASNAGSTSTVNGANAAERPELRLYTACHEGDTLAAIMVLRRQKTATYLYGASANIKRSLMAPYALQWQAMQDARATGCALYDLFGIPPNDDPGHPMAGLYRFKTGFGGKIIHRSGSWDFACHAPLYALFSTAERARKKLRDIKKRKPGTGKE